MPMSRFSGGSEKPLAGELTSSPPMKISPPFKPSRPAMQRKVVVLPQPEGPKRVIISPFLIEKLTWLTIVFVP